MEMERDRGARIRACHTPAVTRIRSLEPPFPPSLVNFGKKEHLKLVARREGSRLWIVARLIQRAISRDDLSFVLS